jgi:hypothetical protein
MIYNVQRELERWGNCMKRRRPKPKLDDPRPAAADPVHPPAHAVSLEGDRVLGDEPDAGHGGFSGSSGCGVRIPNKPQKHEL